MEQISFKSRPKISLFYVVKMNTFDLIKKLICSFTSKDIKIIVLLKVDFNRK
jgi:hypothetical protein